MRECLMISMIQQLKVSQEVTEGAVVHLFLEAVIKELRHVLANISGFLNLFCLIHPK